MNISTELLEKMKAILTKEQLQPCMAIGENVLNYSCSQCDGTCRNSCNATCTANCKSGSGSGWV